MKQGDIILLPFPFSDQMAKKVRPAVVIAYTKDRYEDIIACAISSSVPQHISENEILIEPSKINNLRALSTIKIDRIVTIDKNSVITTLGKLTEKQLGIVKRIFRSLPD